MQSSDEDDDAILEAEHVAWRRLFRPFLLDSKVENIKKGGLTLEDQQRCGHLIIPEVDPSDIYPCIRVLAGSLIEMRKDSKQMQGFVRNDRSSAK